ncbi:hypothetical protein V2J09_016737 [Rumex salicifolius]
MNDGAYALELCAAKSIVANGLARRCIIQVSYAIGGQIVKENFDFRPRMIVINLDLKRGGNVRFLKTIAYGHFGRDDAVVKPLKWEA